MVKGRILLFRENRTWGFVPELKSIGFEEKDGYYERPCDPSEIEAAYKLEGTFTNYKGYEVEIINSFEPDEYVKEQSKEPSAYTPIVNRFFEQDGQKVFRLEFIESKDIEAAKKLGLKLAYEDTRQWGDDYLLDLPDNEIPDVWQIRKPVEGFPMLGEEKVYIKKDGVWLPRKEYGSRIDE